MSLFDAAFILKDGFAYEKIIKIIPWFLLGGAFLLLVLLNALYQLHWLDSDMAAE